MSTEFKIGDRVECIDANDISLVQGGKYTVSECRTRSLVLLGERYAGTLYHVSRFKLISSPKHASKNTQDLIKQECAAIQELLLEKNREYGNAAINPVRIFSTCDTIEQINVRIDDKLSRIKYAGKKKIKEDTVLDLIGYLILRRIADKINGEDR